MTETAAGEVIYEVEARLDPSIVAEFDAWLPGHVREVIACPGFAGAEIQHPVGEDPAGEVLRRTQYRVESMAALERYFEQDAPRLRADGAARFGERAVFSRRLFTPSGVPLRLPEEPVICRNCDAQVPGRFCAECGQSRDIHVLSMHEVVGDVTHSLLHLDSRAWRTLKALVLKPGLLTNEFIAGRHQRYLPPFRLYLVISVAFFALSALLPDGQWLHANAEGETVVGFGRTGTQDEDAQRGKDAAELDRVIGEMRNDVPVEGTQADTSAAGSDACDMDLGDSDLAYFEPYIEDACRKIRADGGRRLGEVFLANSPKMMFVFLPLMAAVAMLFYWRPRRLYAEHLVMFLHTHALLFLWLALSVTLESIALLGPAVSWLGAVENLMMLYLPWYVFRAMRVVYGDGRVATAVKFTSIALLYFILLGVIFAVGLILSMLSL